MAEPTAAEISRVISGYNQASGAADYADTIVCEMEQVDGDRYKMIWSTKYDGNFTPDK